MTSLLDPCRWVGCDLSTAGHGSYGSGQDLWWALQRKSILEELSYFTGES